MKLIRPITITDARLTSASAPEADYAAWAAGTAYTVGQRRIRVSTHGIYECLVAHTSVSGTPPESNPTQWLYVQPTNRWACFDTSISTVTTATGSLSYTITPGVRFGALALVGVQAGSVTVTVTQGGTTIYTATRTLTQTVSPIVDYLTYWLAEFQSKTVLLLDDLPSQYSGAVLTVTLTGSAIQLGALVIGQPFDIGRTQRGFGAGITDYSKKDVDSFGNTTFVKRAYSKQMQATLVCSNTSIDSVARLLSALRATPLMFYAESGLELSTAFGYTKDWRTVIEYANYAIVNLTVEGLT